MRTTMLRACVLGLAASAAPAMAQDNEQFTVNSTVLPYCSELTVSSVPMNLGELTGNAGQLVTAFAGSGENTRELAANFYCNAPAKVTIKALPLMNADVPTVSDSQSFTNRVDYTASLKWRDLEGSVSSTAAAAQEINASQANIGVLRIAVKDPVVANNRRPVAGSYAGQVQLTISLTQ